MADANADRQLDGQERSRFRSDVAFADDLPFADGSFDLALSSFVFQLVPNRARALREARRVLRPGGTLAYVSWLQDDRRVRAGHGLRRRARRPRDRRPRSDGRSGDLPSAERASRRAPSGRVRRCPCGGAPARTPLHGRVLHRVPRGIRRGDAVPRSSTRTCADGCSTELHRRLARLSIGQLTLRFPIVFASGRRSGA